MFFLTVAVHSQSPLVKKGDKAYEKGNYVAALNYYKKADEKGDADAATLARIGVCYFYMNNFEKAGEYFGKVGDTQLNETQLLLYGLIVQRSGDYSKAQSLFEQSKSKGNSSPAIESLIHSCKWASVNTNEIPNFSVTIKEYAINAPAMGIRFWGDKVVFAANPENKVAGTSTPMDLYYASYGENTIGRAFILANNLVYPNKEGGVCFADNNKTMYFTKEEFAGGGKLIYKIFSTKFDGSKWRDMVALPFNNSAYSCAFPTVSADGKIMVFASDAQGGKGGYDLWVTQKVGDGWGKIINISDINTDGDETFPYIDNNNTLYFASNGHPNFGGLDIFYCASNNGKWANPQNAMKPINSSYNDFGFALNPKNENQGFICSNRAGDGTYDHFYEISINPDDFQKGLTISNVSSNTTDNNASILEQDEINAANNSDNEDKEFEARKNTLLKKYNVRSMSELKREQREAFNDELNNPEKYRAKEEGRESLISNTENTNNNVTSTTDVIFKVQFLSSTQPIENAPTVQSMKHERYFYKGLYRYTVGTYNEVPEADAVKKIAQNQGYYDAFIAVFDKNSGERIPDYNVYGGDFTSMGNGANSNYSRDGVILKVQLISARKQIKRIPEVNGISAEYYEHDGMYKYTVGVYEDLASAEQMRQTAIKKGYKEAFLVAFDKATNKRKTDYIIYNH